MVARRAPDQRVHPAGVVADHAADDGTVRRAGLRPEQQAVGCQPVVERIADDAGLDPHGPRVGVETEDLVELPQVDDQSVADHLARERGAGAARDEWNAVLARVTHDRPQVLDAFRHHDPQREFPVTGRVARVDDPVHPVGEDPAFDPSRQLGQSWRQLPWTRDWKRLYSRQCLRSHVSARSVHDSPAVCSTRILRASGTAGPAVTASARRWSKP